jgi:hypothetical protein
MASTKLPPRSQVPGGPARPAPTLAPGGTRRRWSLALVAVLITIGSALAFVVLWMNAGGREPVLALQSDVAAGQTIEADDLTVVRIAVDPGILPVASSARDQVIGQPAAVDLLAGSLLVAEAVGDDAGLDANTAVIPVPVPPEKMPAGLETGDRVIILYTPPSSGTDTSVAADEIGDGRVFDVRPPEDTGSDIGVSLTVDNVILPQVAAAIQSDQIILAKTSPRG